MKEKMNLTIDKRVKEQARKLARSRGVSVSQIVEKLLKNATESQENWEPKSGSVVARLAGSIPYDGDDDYKDLLTSALLEKKGYEENPD